MTESDLDQVCAIEQATFSDPWSRASFAKAITEPTDIYLVCDVNGEIAGYCGLWGVAGEGQITNVAVKDTFRRQGIGEEMLTRLLAEGREKDLNAYTLEVRVSNESAIRLYHRLGFADAGIRKRFYTHPTEDALIMWIV